MAENVDKITVLTPAPLRAALEAERTKIEQEHGLRASLSQTAVMVLRRGLRAQGGSDGI